MKHEPAAPGTTRRNYLTERPDELDWRAIVDAAENVVVAHGMGWDMDGVIEQLRAALPVDSPCRSKS